MAYLHLEWCLGLWAFFFVFVFLRCLSFFVFCFVLLLFCFSQVPWKPLRVAHAGLRVDSSYSNQIVLMQNLVFQHLFFL
jgi:hypothetical protein